MKLILLFSLLIAAVPALGSGPGDELIINGTMEANSSWVTYGSPTSQGQSATVAHTGTYSWSVVSPGGYAGGFQSAATINLTSGHVYRLSAWVYSSTFTTEIVVLNNGGTFLWDSALTSDGTALWKHLTVDYTAAGNYAVKLVCVDNNSSGSVYVDDVSLLEVFPVASNWYVRPGGSGSQTGGNWDNAWDSGGIAWSSVNGGDTIWMAGGTYSSQIVPANSGSASNYIYIKRVQSTDAVPTAASGWTNAFDAQVNIVLTNQSNIVFSSATLGSYTYWDGRVDSGIRLKHGGTTNWLTCGSIIFVGGGQTQVVFTNLDCAGPLGATPGSVLSDNQTVFLGASYVTFANCRIHGDATLVKLDYTPDHITFDHCKIYDGVNDNPDVAHPNLFTIISASEVTIKYCEFWNWPVEGIFIKGDSGVFYIYGNIFRDPYITETEVPRCFETSEWPSTSGGAMGPMYVYNNTFVGVNAVWSTSNNGGSWTNGSVARNNIYWGGGGWPAPFNSDYDYGTSSPGETNGVNGAGQSPFVNYAAGDLHIVRGIGSGLPRDKGTAITPVSGQTYGIDMDGNIRGSVGGWDIGAYENTNAAVILGTINVGTVNVQNLYLR